MSLVSTPHKTFWSPLLKVSVTISRGRAAQGPKPLRKQSRCSQGIKGPNGRAEGRGQSSRQAYLSVATGRRRGEKKWCCKWRQGNEKQQQEGTKRPRRGLEEPWEEAGSLPFGQAEWTREASQGSTLLLLGSLGYLIFKCSFQSQRRLPITEIQFSLLWHAQICKEHLSITFEETDLFRNYLTDYQTKNYEQQLFISKINEPKYFRKLTRENINIWRS